MRNLGFYKCMLGDTASAMVANEEPTFIIDSNSSIVIDPSPSPTRSPKDANDSQITLATINPPERTYTRTNGLERPLTITNAPSSITIEGKTYNKPLPMPPDFLDTLKPNQQAMLRDEYSRDIEVYLTRIALAEACQTGSGEVRYRERQG
jgi:hypothetical protein